MTLKGEQLTIEGEFYETEFHSAQRLNISFLKGSNQSNDINLSVEEAEDAETTYKMVFAVKGDIHCINGSSSNAFMTINSQQYNLIAVSKGMALQSANRNEPFEVVSITLNASFLSRYLPPEHPASTALFRPTSNEPVFFSQRNLYITPEINAILNTIENSTHTGFCKRLFLESKVIELLVLQISQYELTENEQLLGKLKKEDLDKMNEVKEILINNIDSQLSLRTLAHMVGTNEFNLKKNFKAAFGTTVYGYFNQYKMEQAKAMLIEGESKISEVSGKMGYKHATHFTNAFKKYFGYLPTKIKISFLIIDPELYLFFFSF